MTNSNHKKAILVGVCASKKEYQEKIESLAELNRLADTAEIEVCDKFIQIKRKIDSAFYAGKGFLTEIVNKMEMYGAEYLIFDNDLSPTQNRNISDYHKIKVIDRTEIILEIFRMHAGTRESKLQVKLASLKYQLPRLKKLWSHFSGGRVAAGVGSSGQSGGSSGSGTGGGSSQTSGKLSSAGGAASRGMGEKQLEVDTRLVKNGISKIGAQLNNIMQQEKVRRKRRTIVKKICLIGYTNAGKSTLFNAITDAGVLVEDKLFATLDSTARAFNSGKGDDLIISDTVGFISNLPHHLVASFRATLKEVIDADLLLHVVDGSDPNFERNIAAVDDVLEQLGADKIPTLKVFNKSDCISVESREQLLSSVNNPIMISALTGENVDSLISIADNNLNISHEYELMIPLTEQKIIATLHDYVKILSKTFVDNDLKLKAVINDGDMRNLRKYVV